MQSDGNKETLRLADFMSMRKFLTIFACLLPLLAACTPAPTPLTPLAAPGTTLTGTISIWTSWDGPAYDHLVQSVDAYQSVHPNLSFDLQSIAEDELLERYLASSVDGPVILIGPAAWGVSLYDLGFAADVQPYLDPSVLSALQPAALGSVHYGNALTGLPLTMRGVVTYRNTRILPDPPGSLEHLESLASQGSSPVLFTDASLLYSGGHLIALGGDWMDADGPPAFNRNEAGSQWLSLMGQFARLGPLAFNEDTDGLAFMRGEAAIIFDGSWNWQRYSEALGANSLAVDPWLTAGSRPLAGFISTENAYINPQRPQPQQQAAASFVNFMLSVEGQAILAEGGAIPIRLDVSPDEDLISQVMSAFQGGVALPVLPQMESYYAPINAALQAYLLEGYPAAEVLSQAEAQILQTLGE